MIPVSDAPFNLHCSSPSLFAWASHRPSIPDCLIGWTLEYCPLIGWPPSRTIITVRAPCDHFTINVNSSSDGAREEIGDCLMSPGDRNLNGRQTLFGSSWRIKWGRPETCLWLDVIKNTVLWLDDLSWRVKCNYQHLASREMYKLDKARGRCISESNVYSSFLFLTHAPHDL